MAATVERHSPRTFAPEADLFQKVVMGVDNPAAKELFDGPTDLGRQEESGEQVVSAVAKDPRAVGFIGYGASEKLDKRVRIVAIARDDGSKLLQPVLSVVGDGKYPLATP